MLSELLIATPKVEAILPRSFARSWAAGTLCAPLEALIASTSRLRSISIVISLSLFVIFKRSRVATMGWESGDYAKWVRTELSPTESCSSVSFILS